jgi:hypothetical protein
MCLIKQGVLLCIVEFGVHFPQQQTTIIKHLY